MTKRKKRTYRPTHSQKSPEKRDFVVHTHRLNSAFWSGFFVEKTTADF